MDEEKLFSPLRKQLEGRLITSVITTRTGMCPSISWWGIPSVNVLFYRFNHKLPLFVARTRNLLGLACSHNSLDSVPFLISSVHFTPQNRAREKTGDFSLHRNGQKRTWHTDTLLALSRQARLSISGPPVLSCVFFALCEHRPKRLPFIVCILSKLSEFI